MPVRQPAKKTSGAPRAAARDVTVPPSRAAGPAPGSAHLEQDGPLGTAAALRLQRLAGNRTTSRVLAERGAAAPPAVRRYTEVGPEGGGIKVVFDDGEALPSMVGNLASDKAHVYRRLPDEERTYIKTPRAVTARRGAAELAAIQKATRVKELQTAKNPLFDVAAGGAIAGSFEFVANYLYSEVVGADPAAAQVMWNQVWAVDDAPDVPVAVRLDPDRKALLTKMIDLGLKVDWDRIPINEIIATKVAGTGAQPAKSMPIVEAGLADYVVDVQEWRPWSATTGVGFHTTLGDPAQVASEKADGGWGGILQTINVDFARTRYGLDEGWNPLGPWLKAKGPAFRKGIKDNELLSTVSVATAIHGTVRFPLADRTKAHTDEVRKGEQKFKMSVNIYAVSVREGYATFALQGANAFGEIATGDIPIQDIIGWTTVTRWHDYEGSVADGVPATADFEYEMGNFVRNPKFPKDGIYERVFQAARAEVAAEADRAKAKYTAQE